MQFGVRIINSWNGNGVQLVSLVKAHIFQYFSITARSSMLAMTYRAVFRIATALFTGLYLDVEYSFAWGF